MPTKVCLVKAMVFPIVMYGWKWDYKESWALKNWCFWTVMLEKILESPLDCKEIKPVNPKGNQSWILIGRTDTEAETPNFGHLMWRTDFLGKTLMLGKIEGRRRRGGQRMRWLDGINQCNGHELEQTLGDGGAQGGQACCSPWGRKESDMAWQLNNNKRQMERLLPAVQWLRLRASNAGDRVRFLVGELRPYLPQRATKNF